MLDKGSGNLLADFVIIPSHGDNFVFPYEPIYNHVNRKYENCLVLMFLYYDTGKKKYPILFDYWLSQIYYEENEKYFSKSEIFKKALNYVVESGLKFENIIFDAGFFKKDVIEYIESKGLKYISRCSKNKNLTIERKNIRADKLFINDYNGSFYYFHRYREFLNDKVVKIFDFNAKVVAIAKDKAKLLDKDLIFLVTNNLNLLHTQILKLYKSRWAIETFFRTLKSYLGLSVFYRNNFQYVNDKINLALSAFFILQEVAFSLNKTIYQTLKAFQNGLFQEIFDQTIQNSSNYIYCCDLDYQYSTISNISTFLNNGTK